MQVESNQAVACCLLGDQGSCHDGDQSTELWGIGLGDGAFATSARVTALPALSITVSVLCSNPKLYCEAILSGNTHKECL